MENLAGSWVLKERIGFVELAENLAGSWVLKERIGFVVTLDR